jgi:hypothetical protein
MSLITGNKVKKTHKPRYCEKEIQALCMVFTLGEI